MTFNLVRSVWIQPIHMSTQTRAISLNFRVQLEYALVKKLFKYNNQNQRKSITKMTCKSFDKREHASIITLKRHANKETKFILKKKLKKRRLH